MLVTHLNEKGSGNMAKLVAGIAMSHSPMIMTSEEAAGEKGQGFLQKAVK